MRNRIKNNKSLFSQVMFTAIAFIVMAVTGYLFMSAIIRSGLERNVNALLDSTQRRVEHSFLTFETTLESFSEATNDILLSGGTEEELADYITGRFDYIDYESGRINGIVRYFGYFEALPGGAVLISDDGTVIRNDDSMKETPWYALAIEGNGAIVQTVPKIVNGERRNTYVRRIFDGLGNHIGVVGLEVQLENIAEYIVNTTMSQGSFGMLFSPDKTVFVHESERFVGMKVYDPLFPPHVHYDRIKNGETVSEANMIDYKGNDAVGYFRPFYDGWYLGLVMPKKGYYQNLTYMGGTVIGLAVVLGGILIGILVSIDKRRLKSDKESWQKSMFLANMSHEIRTPINAIVGMTAIGRKAVHAERKDYCFEKIDDASKHLLGVINDILDISKIEANKMEMSPTAFPFEKMIRQVVNVINYRVDEKKQKLTVFVDGAIPKTIITDEQRLSQVITNLLSNAVKFTPEQGDITLKAYYGGEQGALCMIKIEVTDTGIGIAPGQQEQLFHAFQQAESSTTRKYGGTGLGLSISKSIVEMMGGRIWVDSEVGKGATFGFTVLVEHAGKLQNEMDSMFINTNSEEETETEIKNIFAGQHILLAEDVEINREIFTAQLEPTGAMIDCAENGREAVRMFTESPTKYGMIFMDVQMPEMDGFEATGQIRSLAHPSSGTIPIVAMTANVFREDIEKCLASGMNDHLGKPVEFQALIAVAKKYLL